MTTITILETQVLHASDSLFWLDGSTAESTNNMQRIAQPIALTLTQKPSDLQYQHGKGKTAVWRNSQGEILDGNASEVEKEFTAVTPFAITGAVQDATGFYNPRLFSVTAGSGNGHDVVLYPTPAKVQFGATGGLIANLRFTSNTAVVPWALLTATVTIPGSSDQIYTGQSNQHGDVRLPLHRLPPLPEGVTHYDATLSVKTIVTAVPETLLDPSVLIDMTLEDLTTPATFSNPIGFEVVPGEIQIIRSASKDHLSVQPS